MRGRIFSYLDLVGLVGQVGHADQQFASWPFRPAHTESSIEFFPFAQSDEPNFVDATIDT